MAKWYSEKFLAVIFLTVNIENFYCMSWNDDKGQGLMLNSQHYPVLEGTFEAFFHEDELNVAASNPRLDWSSRSPAEKDVQKDENVSLSISARTRRLLQSTDRNEKDFEPARRIPTRIRSFGSKEGAPKDHRRPLESSEQDPRTGAVVVRKFRRRPQSRNKSDSTPKTEINQDANKENIPTTVKPLSNSERPLITVRNQVERPQKVKKRNKHRQKTMHLATTTSSIESETPGVQNLERLPSRRSSNEESKVYPTSEPQSKLSWSPITPQGTTRRPNYLSEGTRKPLSRGSVRFGDKQVTKDINIEATVKPSKEQEERNNSNFHRVRNLRPTKPKSKEVKSESKRSERQHRQPLRKADFVSSTQTAAETTTISSQPEVTFEVFRNDDSQSKIITATNTTPTASSIELQPSAVSDASNPNLPLVVNLSSPRPPTEFQPPIDPYYQHQQGYLPYSANQHDPNVNSYGALQDPYFPHQQQTHDLQERYYFNPHPFDTFYGSDPGYGPQSYHPSPHLQAVRRTILETQRDQSTTNSPTFTLPNFKIPTIDFNHKGCKTIFREVEEVPASERDYFPNYSNYPNYPTQYTRYKREVKSIIMTKECIFPEGVPAEATQNMRSEKADSTTATSSTEKIEKRYGEENTGSLSWEDLRKADEKTKIDPTESPGKSKSREEVEEKQHTSQSEANLFRPPRYDPLRGYVFDK